MFRSFANDARLIAVGILLCTTSFALGQVQGMQAFDNRLEGTNIHTNALQDFSLIAVHRMFQTFVPNATLHVRFFLPRISGSTDKKIFVEAAELQDSFHYFMQAKSPGAWKEGNWNVFGPWPTKDVIDRLGLQASNVGVRAGYRINSGPPVFLPVDVYQTSAIASPATYTFHVITGSDLQSLDVSVTNAAGAIMAAPKAQQKCNKSYNLNCKLYAAGSVISFSLDMSALPTGEYHIKLLGHIPGNLTPTSFDIVLYHPHS